MPVVERVETAPSAPARGSMPPGDFWTVAGWSNGLVGTLGMTSASEPPAAVARPELVRAAPQAPTRTAIGTSALAFCKRESCRAMSPSERPDDPLWAIGKPMLPAPFHVCRRTMQLDRSNDLPHPGVTDVSGGQGTMTW